MHYKNGREAKNGDKVLLTPTHGAPMIGILYDAVAGNDYCNGRLAPTAPNDTYVNLKECLHVDDVLAALPEHVVNTTAPAVTDGTVIGYGTIQETPAVPEYDAEAPPALLADQAG